MSVNLAEVWRTTGPARAAPARWPYTEHRTMAQVMGNGGVEPKPDKVKRGRRAVSSSEVLEVLARTSTAFGVSLQALASPSRTDDLAQARFAAMLVLRRRGYSYPNIARATGRRNHTTCIHGVSRARQLEAMSPAYARAVRAIEA